MLRRTSASLFARAIFSCLFDLVSSAAARFRSLRGGDPSFLLFFLCPTLALAQGPQPGYPSFSPSDNYGYYSINLQNLAINVDVPTRTKTGFGTFHKTGSSYVTSARNNWQVSELLSLSSGGVPGAVKLLGSFVGAFSSNYTCNGQAELLYSNWLVSDNQGTVHNFPTSFKADTKGCYPGGTAVSTDNSGYTLVVDSSLNTTLYTRDGEKTSAPFATIFTSSCDPNGNCITASSSDAFYHVSYVDKLGINAMTSATQYPPSTVTYTYPDKNGNTVTDTINVTSFPRATGFGCGYAELSEASKNHATSVTFASGTSQQATLSLSYEPTPNNPGYYTGRLASIALPTGGHVTFGYSGGNGSNGINCDGTPGTLTRTTPDGSWTYVHTPPAIGSLISTTTVADPLGNETDYTFSAQFEVKRIAYQGACCATPLKTVITCYNGNSTNCASAAVNSPITERDVYTTLAGMSTSAVTKTSYDTYGNVAETKLYDFGASSPVVDTTITYAISGSGSCSNIGAHIHDRPCSILGKNAAGSVIAQTNYSYDANGNQLSASRLVSGSTYLMSSATYNANGTLNVATDVNGAQTTYSYNGTGGCNNLFPTSVGEPLTLSRSMTWDCNGGVPTSSTDENGQTTSYGYVNTATSVADPFWRVSSVTDPLGNVTNITFTATSTESSLVFNNNASTTDVLTTFDGLGRRVLKQTRQAPGSSNWDTVAYGYDAIGRQSSISLPCAATTGAGCSGPATTTTYDALGRPTLVTDSGGGTTAYTYNNNDTLISIGPTLAGENAKQRQLEYDGLGRLTSVCEMTSTLPGFGTCSQSNSTTGYWTKYTYNAVALLTGVTQNAQSSSIQTRTYAYDGLGRLISESNPESGAIQYFHDSAPSTPGVACGGTYNGDLVKTYDANGNTICQTYDALHRLTQITYPGGPNSNATFLKYFTYDNPYTYAQIPNSQQNLKGRLSAAGTCSTNISCPTNSVVGEEFSYSVRGEMTDMWEYTPHMTGYYHTTTSYWANGALNTLGGVPGQTAWTYIVDSEGRPATANQGSTNLVTSTTFNPASQPLTITLGLGDTDTYQYDNAGRMKNYNFTVGSAPKSMVGKVAWNSNGSLGSLAITDGFNSGGTQTCKYGDPSTSTAGYDDLGRLIKVDCGASTWQQNFSYDAFGNLTKTVPTGGTGIAWNPGYNSANNSYTLGGTSYDANGGLLTDTFHTYTWDADGHPITIDSSACGTNGTCLTYDAFGRMVEKNASGTYAQVLYGPIGRLGVMNGQSITSLDIPLPGGEILHQVIGGQHFWHTDWLGTTRLSSSRQNRTVIFDRAFAPFGESYKNFGAASDYNFTGDPQDTIAGTFDTENRKLNPNQGRWLSPDPAGIGAVALAAPQTWNRYVYVANNPLIFTDPTGLRCQDDGSSCDLGNSGTGGPPCFMCGGYGGQAAGNYGGGPPTSVYTIGTSMTGVLGSNYAYGLTSYLTQISGYQISASGELTWSGLFYRYDDEYNKDSVEVITKFLFDLGSISFAVGATPPANNGNWFQRGLNYLKTHPVFISVNEILAAQITYQASTGTICANVGAGASVPPTKAVTVGVLNEGNMGNWTNVQSSWGYSFGANLFLGYQASTNSSGTIGGPTVSGVGLSGSYTYGGCTTVP
jgi:RHS repeat-associated protein